MKRLKIMSAVLLVVVMVASTAIGCGRGEQTEKPITLRLAHEYIEGSPSGKRVQEFADRVEQATDGKVKIEVYPFGALTKGFALWTDTVRGLVDMSFALDYVLNVVDPGLYLGGLVYNFSEWEQAYQFAQHPDGAQKVLNMLEQYGVKGLGLYPATLQLITVANREIKSWRDLKGLRVMGIGGDVGDTYGKITGVQFVFVPPIELYSPLAQGLIDAAHTSPIVVWGTRLYEVTRYGYMWNFGVQFAHLWMNMGVWNKLPAEYQEIMLQTARDLAPWHLQLVKDEDRKAIEELGKVMTLHRESEEDRLEIKQLWQEALEKKGYYRNYDPELLALARELGSK